MTPDTPLPDRDGNGSSVDESAAQGTTALRPEAPLSGGYGEPVAWRVKDYADGWIIYQQESAAAAYRAETGALMEPLYDSSLLSRAQAAEARLGDYTRIQKLRHEYRPSMTSEVVHDWARDLLQAISALQQSEQAEARKP